MLDAENTIDKQRLKNKNVTDDTKTKASFRSRLPGTSDEFQEKSQHEKKISLGSRGSSIKSIKSQKSL